MVDSWACMGHTNRACMACGKCGTHYKSGVWTKNKRDAEACCQ